MPLASHAERSAARQSVLRSAARAAASGHCASGDGEPSRDAPHTAAATRTQMRSDASRIEGSGETGANEAVRFPTAFSRLLHSVAARGLPWHTQPCRPRRKLRGGAAEPKRMMFLSKLNLPERTTTTIAIPGKTRRKTGRHARKLGHYRSLRRPLEKHCGFFRARPAIRRGLCLQRRFFLKFPRSHNLSLAG